MRPEGDERYEQLRARWQAKHLPPAEPPPPPFRMDDVDTWADAPCLAPGAWRYLSPPADDEAMTEAWGRSGARVQQVVDYQHTLTAIRAYCDWCPQACKDACGQLRLEQTKPTLDKTSVPAAGVYGGVLYLDNGSPISRERLEAKARKQRANERATVAKRKARAALRAADGDAEPAA